MNKLNNRKVVIERYWPEYLEACMRSLDGTYREFEKLPTEDGFWKWYITDGPMGVKHKGRLYNGDRVEYV